MDYRKIIGLAAIAIVMQGCASMSGQECMVADWQAIGYEDGVRGSTADRIGNHRKACAKHGIAPDLQAYQKGRDAGLRFSLGMLGARDAARLREAGATHVLNTLPEVGDLLLDGRLAAVTQA